MLAAQIIAAVALVAALAIVTRIERGSDAVLKIRAQGVLVAGLIFLIYTLLRGH